MTDEITKLMEQDTQGMLAKSWAEVLRENPQHKGGLAQLAFAEEQARSRSTAEPPKTSAQNTSR